MRTLARATKGYLCKSSLTLSIATHGYLCVDTTENITIESFTAMGGPSGGSKSSGQSIKMRREDEAIILLTIKAFIKCQGSV